MPKTELEFHYFYDPDTRESMLTLEKAASIDPDDAAALGIVYYDKGEYWYLPAPRADWKAGAFDRIEKVFDAKGYTVKWALPKDAGGQTINPNETYNIDKYKLCPEARKIAQQVIIDDHPKLASANILYILESYTPKPDEDGKFTWAWASKISGLYRWLTGYDFCIHICDAVWSELDKPQKEALIDHELCHCTISGKGRWKMRKHDVEDFYEIVQRHGDWSGDVHRMTSALSQNKKALSASLKSATKKVVQKLEAARESEVE